MLALKLKRQPSEAALSRIFRRSGWFSGKSSLRSPAPFLVTLPVQVKSKGCGNLHKSEEKCADSKHEERHLAERITAVTVRKAITRRPDLPSPWEGEADRAVVTPQMP